MHRTDDNKLVSPKEFYYTEIAPEERGRSYQFNYHQHLLLENAQAGILHKAVAHVPRLSNDPNLEEIVEDLIDCTDGQIRERLEKTFVAKRRSYLPDAGAHIQQGQIDGDLVFFNVGLSDAAFQYSILFTQMVDLKDSLLAGDYEAAVHLSKNAERLATAQKRWQILEDTIQLSRDDEVLEPTPQIGASALGIADTTDRFILAHEIAHHLLGHTGGQDDASRQLENALTHDQCQWRTSLQRRWRQELDADCLAVLLVAGLACGGNRKNTGARHDQAALGSVLTITVIGQIAPDDTSTTESHPSVRNRYDQCVQLLGLLPDYDPRPILRDIQNFQRLLHRTQGRGLGREIQEI